MQVLLVEDDKNLSHALKQILTEADYIVDAVADGQSGLDYGKSGIYDVIILDVMLPKKNGYDVVKELRHANIDCPVLLLTARDSIADKITGLDNGADDYMTKPFSPAELKARLRALLRRKDQLVFESLSYEGLTLDLESHDLSCGTKTIHLGFKEFSIAKLLFTNPTQVLTKEMLIAKVWGIESSADDNNVEAYISFLRKKFRFLDSKVTIETLRKTGYRLSVEE